MRNPDTDDPETHGQGGTPRNARIRRYVGAGFLTLLGILQALQLKHFKLDWPAFASILMGTLFSMLPVDQLASLIESLEIGKTKILFRQTQQLEQRVETAVKSAASLVGIGVEVENGSGNVSEPADAGKAVPSREMRSSQTLTVAQGEVLTRSIIDLLATDKEAALIRLSLELEKRISELASRSGLEVPRTGIVWGRTVPALVGKHLISHDTAKALIEFRNVRNGVIHSSSSFERNDSVVTSAIDSGLRLLNLL